MNNTNLELSIMSCLLLKPELMEKIIVEDKHFIKHQRLWKFMKAFYEHYKNFDINLMYSVCREKKQIAYYLEMIADIEITTCHFDLYQKRLIEEYETSIEDKAKVNLIYDLANQLWVGSIDLENFKNKVNEIIGGTNESK